MGVIELLAGITIFNRLLGMDYWLFDKINQQWTNGFFDNLLPFLRESELWIPFYLFLLVFITVNFSLKGLWWAMTLGMTGILSDLISSHLIKQFIFRYRPCRDPVFSEHVRFLVNYCPMSSSFTSSHACNHFAAATFIFLTLRQTTKWWALVFGWAFVIAYAQVYVGVHYPFDILGGAILGCLIGYGMNLFFAKQFRSLL